MSHTRNGPMKLNRQNQSLEREGSAHSDYFSLAEDQHEPLVTQPRHHYVLHHNGRPESPSPYSQPPHPNTHSSLSPEHRARPGSPVILEPLTAKYTQTLPAPSVTPLGQIPGSKKMLVSDFELTREMRKMQMGHLMTKIRNQKPACELDYNVHYKAIENQHKMLLDNSDRLSLYGSSDESLPGETHRSTAKSRGFVNSGPTNSRMLRAHSFDRDLLNSKGGSIAVKGIKANTSSKNKSKNDMMHPSSPQLNRRFSKSNRNLAQNNADSSADTLNRVASINSTDKGIMTRGLNSSSQSPQKNRLPYGQPVHRSNSNIERPSTVVSMENNLGPSLTSSPRTPLVDVRATCDELGDVKVPLEMKASSGNLNLSTTVSSSCDIEFSHEDQSGEHETLVEGLRLNLRSDSQSPVYDQHGNPSSFLLENRTNTSDTPHNDIQAIGNSTTHNDETEPMRTSTPVPNILHDISATACSPTPNQDIPLINPSPRLLKVRK